MHADFSVKGKQDMSHPCTFSAIDFRLKGVQPKKMVTA